MIFKMGRLVATPGAIAFCETNSVDLISLVRRHLRCDWGDLDAVDKASNDEAVRTEDSRILSMYQFPEGKIWIITDQAPAFCGHRNTEKASISPTR